VAPLERTANEISECSMDWKGDTSIKVKDEKMNDLEETNKFIL